MEENRDLYQRETDSQPTETQQPGQPQKPGKEEFHKGLLFGSIGAVIVCTLIFGLLLIFGAGTKGKNIVEGNKNSLVTDATADKLKEIRKLIEDNYLYYDKLDEDALQEGIIKGYVNGLGEVYTVYYNEEETRALMESTSGTFGGIGVVIMKDNTTGLITFTNVYKDKPGHEAGFKNGDIVYKVNGEDVSGMDLDTVVSKIRGEVGTQVEITVLRGDKMEEYTGKATRALITNTTVSYEMKSDKVGYIQVTSFEDVTYNQFEEALNDLTKQGMKGLVIDLRSNPGGNLSTVCQMADLILPKGTVVSIKDRNGNGQSFTSDDEHKLNVPLVVLVNGYSASASEIFAGAVKDFKIGTLVGTTTYGKGIVQNVYQLKDGTAFKITSSEYFTPNGTNIHGKGIEPDVKIEYERDENNADADNQLDKALEVLKGKMK